MDIQGIWKGPVEVVGEDTVKSGYSRNLEGTS